jgi:uncharacterized protein with GYD domain
MATFVMLSRSVPGAFGSSQELKSTAAKVRKMLETEVPEARWICSYALLGAYDALDVYEAPNIQHAANVAAIVRTFAKSETMTMPAEDWQSFVKAAGSPK